MPTASPHASCPPSPVASDASHDSLDAFASAVAQLDPAASLFDDGASEVGDDPFAAFDPSPIDPLTDHEYAALGLIRSPPDMHPTSDATPLFAMRDSPAPADPSLRFRCLLADCPLYPHNAFSHAGQLSAHLRTVHRPTRLIPAAALEPYKLFACRRCDACVYTTESRLLAHMQEHHPDDAPSPAHSPTLSPSASLSPSTPPAPSPSISSTSSPNPPPQRPAASANRRTRARRVVTASGSSSHAAPAGHVAADASARTPSPAAASIAHSTAAADYYAINAAFFRSFDLDSVVLHEVHSLSLPTLPASSLCAVEGVLSSFLRAALRNLDDDGPTVAIYALPRLLLAPPPPALLRCHLPRLLRERCADLRAGRASALWDAFDWLAHTSAPVELTTVSPTTASTLITRDISYKSPAAVLRRLQRAPYLPPTGRTESLLLDHITTAPNPDLADTALPAEARSLLPSSPLGSGYIHDEGERSAVTIEWSRHLQLHPAGAPDGTGLRSSLLSSCKACLPLVAQWLNSLLYGRCTPAHRRLLGTKTLGAQAKRDKQTGMLPQTAAAATSVRPLSRHPVTRRLVAGYLARRLSIEARPTFSDMGQYGMLPSGCEAASRRHQLHHDLRPPSSTSALAHAALDIKNAHSSVGRLTVYLILAARFRDVGHHLDLLARTYFLSYYHFPTATLIQVGRSYRLHHQTDNLDQGEAIASYAFDLALGTLIKDLLLPRVPGIISTLIHDDSTFAGEIYVPGASDPPADASVVTASSHPLVYAIRLYADLLAEHLRCVLAAHKTLIFQPHVLSDHPCSVSRHLHLLPRGTYSVTHASFRLAGVDVRGGESLCLMCSCAPPTRCHAHSIDERLRRRLHVNRWPDEHNERPPLLPPVPVRNSNGRRITIKADAKRYYQASPPEVRDPLRWRRGADLEGGGWEIWFDTGRQDQPAGDRTLTSQRWEHRFDVKPSNFLRNLTANNDRATTADSADAGLGLYAARPYAESELMNYYHGTIIGELNDSDAKIEAMLQQLQIEGRDRHILHVQIEQPDGRLPWFHIDGAEGVSGAQYMNCATFGGGKGSNNAKFNTRGGVEAQAGIRAGAEIFVGYRNDYWNTHGKRT